MTERNDAISFWDARDADLKERWQRGESATVIAKAYTAIYRKPFTRNQLCSQISRRCGKRDRAAAEIAMRQGGRKGAAIAAAKNPRGLAPSGQMLPLSIPAVAKAFAANGKAAIAEIEAAAPYTGVSMMALESGMCRKPTGGTGADMLYCGRRTEVRRGRYASYCSACSEGLTAGTQRVQAGQLQKQITSGSVRRGYAY